MAKKTFSQRESSIQFPAFCPAPSSHVAITRRPKHFFPLGPVSRLQPRSSLSFSRLTTPSLRTVAALAVAASAPAASP
ncbi:hypothetical protein OH76DRAFT_1398678 [Lentinus brumalis]|uniref:Uncharacterized protein n=1 Tax=Lentinus brumalis TaxID=2498619 RepID=A0A371DPB3_9APHY|nr:hypothetical protein OH76DRAFT_1398678 [Polyporus brumalis]